ncbi:MAG TPA: hypothetical protein VMH50_04070 [Thermoleophilia bacterium]|nr:hypothetical protein [Thermoleophilia bacterium]
MRPALARRRTRARDSACAPHGAGATTGGTPTNGTPPPPEKDSHSNRGTLGTGGRSDRTFLAADQLHDHENEPSWKAPSERSSRWSTQRIVTLVILLAILALVIYLKATGVV